MAISIDRLSGGNTPADGSDPRTFPAIWNATAAILEENVGTGGGGSITVSDTAPTDPAPENGDLWWKSDDGKLFVYYVDGDSSQWVDAAGPSVAVQDTAPTGYEGQLWLDSTDGSMYVYYTDPGGGASSWIGAVSRSGGILQVVKATTSTSSTTTSTTFVDSNISVSITPTSTSSKIILFYSAAMSPVSQSQLLQITNSSNVAITGAEACRFGVLDVVGNIRAFDEPASTSTQTYKIRFRTNSSGGTARIINTEMSGLLIAMEIAG